MTIVDPNYAGYSEAAATIFTRLKTDEVVSGAQKAMGLRSLMPSSAWLHWQLHEPIE